ncbi:MAG: thioesterase family protein [Bacillus sp. (in: firmicutes)]
MKPGLEIGHAESLHITVDESMFAAFGGEVVHPSYSTVSMVYHMEWASRKIILPYLEPHEEGVGASVTVKHLAVSPLGSNVVVTATLIEKKRNMLKTSVIVKNDKQVIGTGEVIQAVLPKKEIEAKLKA